MHTLTFITGNVEKARQLKHHLEHPVEHKKLDIPEIQSLDLEEIASDKAKRAFAELGTPVLVEDTALIFKALDTLPGPLIKWFLTSLENEGLTKLLNGYDDRSAVAKVCFAYCDGEATKTFKSLVYGSIASRPRGERGFGWDPIFIPEGYEETWGEMDTETQKESSMRRVALEKLTFFLSNEGTT